MIAEYNHHRSVPVSTARVARRLSFPRRARASIIHAMTRISLLRPLPSSVRLGLVALGLAGTSLGAQARSDSLPASGSTQAPATLTITPRRPEIGSLVLLSLRRSKASGDSILTISGRMAGEPLHFRPDSTGVAHAFGLVPIEASDSVVARVVVRYASGVEDSLRYALPYPHRVTPTGGRPARARRLRVSKVFTARPDSLTEARVERENAEARAAGRRAHDTPPLWTQPFVRPRSSRITSSFGSGRVFNGRLTSSHGGVDFAGQAGDPVRAANRGVVALVDAFFLAGNVVYIDHGAGVMTGYFHLTQALVAVGDTVERGQEIGLVGATGRVTGPHLHWSARYGEHTVDPMGLIELTRAR
jgi:murein DD-endopeptidase MepM/ murein hydrolase activator NlpD